MKNKGTQFKLTDYESKEKLDKFKEENKEKNELLKDKNSKPKKINVSGWITKSKPPPKTTEWVIWDKKIDSMFEKKQKVESIEEIMEPMHPSEFSEGQSNGMRSEIVKSVASQSSEWETISKEEEEEEKTYPNDSEGYVLETGGYAVDIATNQMIMGEPVTATFAGLTDQFSEMNLSAKSYQLETVVLNESDLETSKTPKTPKTPMTLGKKRKYHEMLNDSEDIPKYEATVYKKKRNLPFDLTESLKNNPPTEKSIKLEKKLKFTPEDIASFKKED